MSYYCMWAASSIIISQWAGSLRRLREIRELRILVQILIVDYHQKSWRRARQKKLKDCKIITQMGATALNTNLFWIWFRRGRLMQTNFLVGSQHEMRRNWGNIPNTFFLIFTWPTATASQQFWIAKTSSMQLKAKNTIHQQTNEQAIKNSAKNTKL